MLLPNCLKSILCAGVLALSVAPFQGASAAVHTITIEGLKFSRDSLHIKRGDTVRFQNSDSAKHAIYSLSPGQVFSLGIQKPGDVAVMTFDHPGAIDVRSAAYFEQMSLKITCQ